MQGNFNIPINDLIKNLREAKTFRLPHQEPLADLTPYVGSSRNQPGTIGYDTTNGLYSYTFKEGDTLGDVIKKIGLESGNGLWGPDGDAQYYMGQLDEQEAWGNGQRGVLPVGKTVFFRKRGDLENSKGAARTVNDATITGNEKVTDNLSTLIKAIRDLGIFNNQKGKQ